MTKQEQTNDTCAFCLHSFETEEFDSDRVIFRDCVIHEKRVDANDSCEMFITSWLEIF